MKIGLIFIAVILMNLSAKAQDTATVGGVGANYANIVLAFNAINNGTLTGHVVLLIQGSNSVNTAAILNASGTGNSNYSSVIIYPTVSSEITGNYDDVIILNGADSVIIDGRINRQGSTNDLKIMNYNYNDNYNSCGIKFKDGATNNIVQFLNLEGKGGFDFGIISFVNSGIVNQGNNNNTIQNCDFDKIQTPSTLRYFSGIYSLAPGSAPNTNNIIANNVIHEFRVHGMLLEGHNKDWEIKNNSFYSTSSGGTFLKLENLSPYGGFNIHHNYLGGTAAFAYGSVIYNNNFVFADISVSDSSESSFDNNIVRGITANNFNTSVSKLTGSINFHNNIFGGDSIDNQIFLLNGTKFIEATPKCNFTNNNLKNIHSQNALISLIFDAGTVKYNNFSNCNNVIPINSCDSVLYNNISNILGSSIYGSHIIAYNIVRNINITNSVCISGNYVYDNFIKNYTSNSISSYGYAAIECYAAYNNVIISDTSGIYAPRGRVVGINALELIYNNIVKLVFDSIDSTINFQGATGLILEGDGAGYVYNNTILIGGKFFGQQYGISSNIKIDYSVNWQIYNNLFYNSNSSSDSTQSKCILYGNSSNVNLFTSDYNNYYLNGSNTSVVQNFPTLADWQSYWAFSSYQDLHSISIDPILSSNPPYSIYDFIPHAPMPGTNTVNNPYDIFGNTRSTIQPTIGAIESGVCAPASLTINPVACQSYTLGGQTYTTTGTYIVSIDNVGSCDTLYTINLTIDTTALNPSIISSNSPLTVCLGDSVLLSGNNNGGIWNTGDTASSIYASAGTYYVTNNYFCGSVNSNYLTINLNTSLTPVIIDSLTYLIVDSNIYNQYQWFLNGVAIPGANSSSYVPANTGNYSLQVLDTNGCASISSVQYFGIVGLNESNPNQLTVTPNPSSGAFTISSSTKVSYIQITNMLGDIIYESEPNSNYTEVNISNFSIGIYTVSCTNEQGISIKKIVIQ